MPDWPKRRDAGGQDWGHHWSLENPLRRWEATRWRISWLGIENATHEVYAIEFVPSSAGDATTGYGRVWLLGTLRSRELVSDALGELKLYAQRERNSLVAAAQAVRRAASYGETIVSRGK